MAEVLIRFFGLFPSSSLGTQGGKLQLSGPPLGERVASTPPTKQELPKRWVPKLELGNQRHYIFVIFVSFVFFVVKNYALAPA